MRFGLVDGNSHTLEEIGTFTRSLARPFGNWKPGLAQAPDLRPASVTCADSWRRKRRPLSRGLELNRECILRKTFPGLIRGVRWQAKRDTALVLAGSRRG